MPLPIVLVIVGTLLRFVPKLPKVGLDQLQLQAVVGGLSGQSAGMLGGYALAVTGVVVGTQLRAKP